MIRRTVGVIATPLIPLRLTSTRRILLSSPALLLPHLRRCISSSSSSACANIGHGDGHGHDGYRYTWLRAPCHSSPSYVTLLGGRHPCTPHRLFSSRVPPRVHQVEAHSSSSSSSVVNALRRTGRQIKDGGIYSLFIIALVGVMGVSAVNAAYYFLWPSSPIVIRDEIMPMIDSHKEVRRVLGGSVRLHDRTGRGAALPMHDESEENGVGVMDVQWYISGPLGDAQVMVRKLRAGMADWRTLMVIVTPVNVRHTHEEQERLRRQTAVRGQRLWQQPQHRGPRAIMVVDNREAARTGRL